jgi:molybdenum cofactor guanylyltransferase
MMQSRHAIRHISKPVPFWIGLQEWKVDLPPLAGFAPARFRQAELVGNSNRSEWLNVYDRAMRSPPDLAAFILAGGQSSRMGTDKAFIELEGRTLLARALELARSVSDDVRIVGRQEKYSSFAPTIEDIFPGCGPLAGIHAALRASPKDLNLILAVDVPFLSSGLLEYIIERAESAVATVTVPRIAQGFQPLCAVYRGAFADTAEQALRHGRYKIDALFATVQTEVIGEPELQGAGFSIGLFRNLNHPHDLDAARE